VGLEENNDIFDALLKPMMKSTLAIVAMPLPLVVVASQDLDKMPVVIQ